MRFPMTKDGHARTVPFHDALIDEGFLDYWRTAPDGFLFVGDRPQKPGASRPAPEQRASEIAAWIQEKIELEDGVSPNHGWRHTFITNAEGVGIPKRSANAITGHNKKKDSSDGYVALPVEILKRELDKYPRYLID
jgi:integrase